MARRAGCIQRHASLAPATAPDIPAQPTERGRRIPRWWNYTHRCNRSQQMSGTGKTQRWRPGSTLPQASSAEASFAVPTWRLLAGTEHTDPEQRSCCHVQAHQSIYSHFFGHTNKTYISRAHKRALRGASSNGRALASHARGSGIDARVLQFFAFFFAFAGISPRSSPSPDISSLPVCRSTRRNRTAAESNSVTHWLFNTSIRVCSVTAGKIVW